MKLTVKENADELHNEQSLQFLVISLLLTASSFTCSQCMTLSALDDIAACVQQFSSVTNLLSSS